MDVDFVAQDVARDVHESLVARESFEHQALPVHSKDRANVLGAGLLEFILFTVVVRRLLLSRLIASLGWVANCPCCAPVLW
jgi:hypothetical protein